MAAETNGKRVTLGLLALIATVGLGVAGATLWAADRFGSAEGRIGVLEAHYGHIREALERIEAKVDRQ